MPLPDQQVTQHTEIAQEPLTDLGIPGQLVELVNYQTQSFRLTNRFRVRFIQQLRDFGVGGKNFRMQQLKEFFGTFDGFERVGFHKKRVSNISGESTCGTPARVNSLPESVRLLTPSCYSDASQP